MYPYTIQGRNKAKGRWDANWEELKKIKKTTTINWRMKSQIQDERHGMCQ